MPTPLADRTTRAFAESLDDVEVGLLPVGSTEQHGPHLPLSTDHLAAEAIAERVDNDAATLLPTLPVGVSDHHRQFHGTLSVSDGAFERFVRETVESLAGHGVRKVVAVNGHGGNEGALTRAARRLRAEGTAFLAPWHWWDATNVVVGHADQHETSVVLHLREELVDAGRLAEAEADGAASWGKRVHGASVGFDTADFTDSGAVGHPSEASAQLGRDLVEEGVEELDALVDWLAARPFDDLRPEPHR
jgi:creatinine amidohydrolase